MFGQYAEVAKWSIYLAILTLIVGVLGAVYNRIDQGGYDRCVAEMNTAKDTKANSDANLFEDLNKTEPEVEIRTVTETVETIKYVTKIVKEPVYVCDDLGDEFIRVRNETRDTIFGRTDSTGEGG